MHASLDVVMIPMSIKNGYQFAMVSNALEIAVADRWIDLFMELDGKFVFFLRQTIAFAAFTEIESIMSVGFSSL
jgi:hypothetical protein